MNLDWDLSDETVNAVQEALHRPSNWRGSISTNKHREYIELVNMPTERISQLRRSMPERRRLSKLI